MPNETRRGVPYLLVLLLLLIALAGGAAAGILGYIWITGGSGEASLSVEDALATLEASEDTVADAVGTAIVDVANTVIADAVAVAVADAVDTSVAAAMAAREPESMPLEFSIVAGESQARFTLEEDLRGVRTTVVGSTSEVGGRIMVDLAKPSASSSRHDLDQRAYIGDRQQLPQSGAAQPNPQVGARRARIHRL